MDKYEALSFCGIYCGSCRNFKKNMGCAGCRGEAVLVDDCPTKACAVACGLLHCGLCGEFPCKMLADFYHDGKPPHRAALDAMERIIQVGPEAWLAEQEG